MADDDLAFTPAVDLRPLIDSKQVSIVELTELFLRRIDALNPRLNAYLTVTAEEARADARVKDQALLRGEAHGPLHGIPISIKDLEMTKGIRTTFGCAIFKDHVPDEDSVVVERVRNSGAIILGKTNTPECGFIPTTDNRLGDSCRNPWNTDCTTGGSSGGAGAAVAGGLCTLGIGSDGGGSIRIPASFCGVYGIKPSQGRVPQYGGVGGPAYSNFIQSGPMTRTVRDSALILQVLSGPDSRDIGCMKSEPPDFLGALEQGVSGLRLAWSPDMGYAIVDPEVAETTSKAARLFEELGCTVEEPGLSMEDPYPDLGIIFGVIAYTSYGRLLEAHAEEFTDYGLRIIEDGRDTSVADYNRSLLHVLQLQARMEAFFERYDLLLTPTMAVPAFPVGQHPRFIGGRPVKDPSTAYWPFTYAFNMTMQPAASIPCGFSSNGMPIGLHIVGRMGEETTVLRASAAFEQARPWADKRPPI